MTPQGRLFLVGGVVLALLVGGAALVAHERMVGARDARITALEGTTKAQAAVIAADSLRVVKADTVRVYQQVTRSDTVLQRLIDSAIVLKHDTVWVTREVLVEAKAAIDSTKKVADACCSLANDRARRIATLDSLNKDLEQKLPSGIAPWLHRGEGILFCGAAVWGAGQLKK